MTELRHPHPTKKNIGIWTTVWRWFNPAKASHSAETLEATPAIGEVPLSNIDKDFERKFGMSAEAFYRSLPWF